MGENSNDCTGNHRVTEGATAPETLRSTDHLRDKMLESGPLGERSRRRSKSLRPKRTAGGMEDGEAVMSLCLIY